MKNRKAIQKMRAELLLKKIKEEMTANRFLARKKFQQWINCMNTKTTHRLNDEKMLLDKRYASLQRRQFILHNYKEKHLLYTVY